MTASAQVLKDPRYSVDVADIKQNYRLQHQAVAMFSTLSDAVGKLVDSKKDIELIKGMAEKILKDIKENKDAHPASLLVKDANKLLETIKELDKSLRSLPKTKGIVDTSYKVSSKIGTAWYYIGSAYGKPSVTAIQYLAVAKASLQQGVDKVNEFLTQDLAGFKKSFQASGITLLSQTEPVTLR